MSSYRVGGCDMSGVWIRVSEEVGERYGGEGVVIGVGRAVELDHCRLRSCYLFRLEIIVRKTGSDRLGRSKVFQRATKLKKRARVMVLVSSYAS